MTKLRTELDELAESLAAWTYIHPTAPPDYANAARCNALHNIRREFEQAAAEGNAGNAVEAEIAARILPRYRPGFRKAFAQQIAEASK